MAETIVGNAVIVVAKGLLVLTTFTVIGAVMYAAYRVAFTIKDLAMQYLGKKINEKEQSEKEINSPVKENNERGLQNFLDEVSVQKQNVPEKTKVQQKNQLEMDK